MKIFGGRRKNPEKPGDDEYNEETIDISVEGTINRFCGHISEGRIVGLRLEKDGLHCRVELEIDGRNYIFTTVKSNVDGLSPGDKVKFANNDGVLTKVQFLAD